MTPVDEAGESVRPPRPLLVLVGAPGSGKSTVGRRVSSTLGADLLDTDEMVGQQAGMPVSEIFVTLGEPAFRKLEEEAVQEALATGGSVVCLGGGAVISERTRDRLAGHRVIWLKVDVSDAASRVGLGVSRPLLVGNVRGRLTTLMRERQTWYEEVSEASIETTGRPVEHVVSDVLAYLHQAKGR